MSKFDGMKTRGVPETALDAASHDQMPDMDDRHGRDGRVRGRTGARQFICHKKDKS